MPECVDQENLNLMSQLLLDFRVCFQTQWSFICDTMKARSYRMELDLN